MSISFNICVSIPVKEDIPVTLQTSDRFWLWRPDFNVAEAEHVRSCTCSMEATLKSLGTRLASRDAKAKTDQTFETEPVYTQTTCFIDVIFVEGTAGICGLRRLFPLNLFAIRGYILHYPRLPIVYRIGRNL